MQSIVKTACS